MAKGRTPISSRKQESDIMFSPSGKQIQYTPKKPSANSQNMTTPVKNSSGKNNFNKDNNSKLISSSSPSRMSNMKGNNEQSESKRGIKLESSKKKGIPGESQKTRYSRFLYNFSMPKLPNEGSKRNIAKEEREATKEKARVGYLLDFNSETEELEE